MTAQKPETNCTGDLNVEKAKLEEVLNLISKLDELLVHESIVKYQFSEFFYGYTSHFRRCLKAIIELQGFS